MALRLPRGIQFGFARLDESKRFKLADIKNSTSPEALGTQVELDPAETGSPTDNAVVLLETSGWPAANNKATRIDANDILVGLDTSAPELFAAGKFGVATITQTGEFTDFTQQGEPSTSGGEQQFWQGTLLEDPSGRQISIPTFKNAKTLTLPLYFDPKLPWYARAKIADAVGKPLVLRARMPEETLYWFGYLSFDADPSITANTPMGNTLTFTALQESTIAVNA